QRNRPTVLEQRDRGGRSRRDRLVDVPHLPFVEDVAVLDRLRAGLCAGLRTFLAPRAEPDQRADDRAQLLQLLPGHVALLQALDVPVEILPHGDHVDQPHDVVLPETLELRTNRPFELRVAEADDEDLNWANGHRFLSLPGSFLTRRPRGPSA